jgi:hypothetical protein
MRPFMETLEDRTAPAMIAGLDVPDDFVNDPKVQALIQALENKDATAAEKAVIHTRVEALLLQRQEKSWKAEGQDSTNQFYASFVPDDGATGWSEPHFNNAGDQFTISYPDGRVQTYSVVSGKKLSEFSADPMLATGFDTSPDEAVFYAVDTDRKGIQIVDNVTHEEIHHWTFSNVIGGIHFTPDSKSIGFAVAGATGDAGYYLYNLQTGENLLESSSPDRSGSGISLSNDKFLAAGGGTAVDQNIDKDILSFDVATGAAGITYEGLSRGVTATAISPDGTLIVGGGVEGDLIVWDAATGRIVQTITTADEGYGYSRNIAFSADGKKIAVSRVATDENPEGVAGIEVYDLADNVATREKLFPDSVSPGAVRFVAGGKLIANDHSNDQHRLLVYQISVPEGITEEDQELQGFISADSIDAAIEDVQTIELMLKETQQQLDAISLALATEEETVAALQDEVVDAVATYTATKAAEAQAQAQIADGEAAPEDTEASPPAPQAEVTYDEVNLYVHTQNFDGTQTLTINGQVYTPQSGEDFITIPLSELSPELLADLNLVTQDVEEQVNAIIAEQEANAGETSSSSQTQEDSPAQDVEDAATPGPVLDQSRQNEEEPEFSQMPA